MKNDTINPFPGLRPFQKNESHLFFGRENHIKEILRKLETFRFVSIVGNSGSGKSSLVRAGIIPRIENTQDHSWMICVMRPGKNPLEELSNALFEPALFGNPGTRERNKQINDSIEILGKNRLSLVQVVRNVLPQGKKLLILVDQFEELFRFNKIYTEKNQVSPASHFVDLLLGAVGQKDLPIYVMMTVRSDFLGDCEQFVGLPEAINDGQFLIPRMNEEELQTSIVGPVDVVHGKISPRLVHQLLNEVGNSPDQLPVLQHVLMRTWEVWEAENYPAKPVDLEEYEKTGGMKKALSNHAEEAYAELNTEKKRNLAEAIFKTITLKGADNRGIRRPTPLSRIAEITNSTLAEVKEIADIFRRADRGFIMPSSTVELHENSVLDISHESLMRVWERLNKWVEEEAESAEIYQRICESALLYEKNMAGLWRDPDLQIAVEWKEKNNPNNFWASQYNNHFKLAVWFMEASVIDKNFMVAEKNRKRRLTNVAITFVLIILSALTLWAYIERNKSQTNENLALSEKGKALKQEEIAKKQTEKAEDAADKAEEERRNAENAKQNAEDQKKKAEQAAMEAGRQKSNAEQAAAEANNAKNAADDEKQKAIIQKRISDSLKTVANVSEKNAYRLRILSIAQNLAIKSTQAKAGTYEAGVKPLLALQAYHFNKSEAGKKFDPEIFYALFSSYRFLQDKKEYTHNFHSGAIKTLCFSPNGQTLASSGDDGKLILTEISNLQGSQKNYPQQPFIIDNIQFNKEGTKIAASTDNNNILIYEVNNQTQKPKQITGLHNNKISALLWYKKQLISASFDMNVRMIDEESSKVTKTIKLTSKPLCMSICEKRNLLVIGCENGSVYLLDLITASEVKELKKISSSNVAAIDFNANGSKIACGTDDGNIVIIQTDNPGKNEINITAHVSRITNIKFSPASNLIASSSMDASVKLWNLDIADEQPVIFSEHDGWVWAMAFSPDGTMLASGGKDKTVRSYVTNQEKLVKLLESQVNRNLTLTEWNNFIGPDIPYEKTVAAK